LVKFGDVYRAYIKPSLDGELIIRKKTSEQTSARLEERKNAVKEWTRKNKQSPSQYCHDKLVSEGKCPEQWVYVAGKGWVKRPVCPIEEMKACLREVMESIPAYSHKRSAGAGGTAPALTKAGELA